MQPNLYIILRAVLAVVAVLVLLVAAPAWAETGQPTPQSQPFAVPNQSPLALSLVPFSPQGAAVDRAGTSRLRLTTAYSSVFVRQSSSRASLDLDMELAYAALAYDYALPHGVRLGLELPAAFYWGGFMDGFIESYHRALGLPNGGREQVPQDLVRYQASSRGRRIISQDSSTQGVGDVRLKGAWSLLARPGMGLSLLGQLSLPSGDPDKGLGAGGAVPALGLAGGLTHGRWSFNANAMYFSLGSTSLLDPLEPDDVWAGSLSLGWAWSNALTLRAQLNGATPLVDDTGVEGLDNGMLQVLLGFQWVPTKGQLISVAFAEDLIYYTSPDFTLSLSWGWTF
ncbi:MAG: DUF3187 family protein [Desulfarculaceae bacterium]|nr:DUF3187 family protein [Desulfarculaceae bacterium]MCF8072867.1 DUF3187 family protein [Desulfarculaceae bacterium]MCF8101035.1 DUF3187 family protein [Desulfarculaceae bacterium]MCF8115578.1 DUF3187 family protein [Desulfarculaceae bacterium]